MKRILDQAYLDVGLDAWPLAAAIASVLTLCPIGKGSKDDLGPSQARTQASPGLVAKECKTMMVLSSRPLTQWLLEPRVQVATMETS